MKATLSPKLALQCQFLCLTLTTLLVGCGQEPAAPPPPAGPQFGSISGQITDPFGAPLASAVVSTTGPVQGSATADNQGRFQFTSLPVGTYTLAFSSRGFDQLSRSAQVRANQDSTLRVQLTPESLPSAMNRAARLTSRSGARLDFEVEVVVIAANGSPLDGLGSDAFSVQSITLQEGSTLSFSRLDVSSQAGTDTGPYSAILLMDQSGSILSTDPTDSRIQAGKIFFSALSPPDNALLAAFASAGSLPYELSYWGSFTSSGSSFYTYLDDLSRLEGGGTPLYASTASMIDLVSTQGSNSNRAVVVFTDGKDTDGGWTREQVTSLARSKSVKLFTVGLSEQVDVKVLSQMAAETGGSMVWAKDARQLVSLYGTLGNMLRGRARFYRSRWTSTLSSGTWDLGGWFYTSIQIQTPTATLLAPFYIEVPRSSANGLPRTSLSRPGGVECPASPNTDNQPELCMYR